MTPEELSALPLLVLSQVLVKVTDLISHAQKELPNRICTVNRI